MTRELIREWSEGDFRLELFDTFTTDSLGKSRLAYRFYFEGELIFEGEDFCCSPCHAIDSDETVGALLGFLSLRPGDTDSEYFDDYSQTQLDFANCHGEELSIHAHELENGIECYASIYGDGALLDFGYAYDSAPSDLKTDDSEDGQTAILELTVSPSIARRAYDYCHGNNGTEPYSDGYEAMECVCEAKECQVYSCTVPWGREECERLGGCFLCGGQHHDN